MKSLRNSGIKPSRLVAFASGKGGVGKTVCTANLALHLASTHRVLTVDLDLGCGNLNASLGVRTFAKSIDDFLGSRVSNLTPLKTKTSVESLDLISCSYTPVDSTALSEPQKERLIDHMRSDESEYVLMDLGAGAAHDILDLFAAADLKVLVTAPESLALHNAFLFVKSLAYRVLSRSLEQTGLAKRHRQDIIKQLYASGDNEIERTIDRIRTRNAEGAALVREILSNLNIAVILNKLQDPVEEKFVTSLQRLSRKYASVELGILGSIPFDPNVKKSLNDVVPFALQYESSPANVAFAAMTTRIQKSLAALYYMPETNSGAKRPRLLSRLGTLWENNWQASSPLGLRNIAAQTAQAGDKNETIRALENQIRETAARHEQEKQEWLREKQEMGCRIKELVNGDEEMRARESDRESAFRRALKESDDLIERLQKAADSRTGEPQNVIQQKDEILQGLEERLRAVEAASVNQRLTELEKFAARKDQIIKHLEEKIRSRAFEMELHQRIVMTVGEQLLANLSGHPAQPVTVVSMEEGNGEAVSFAGQFKSVLTAAGWPVSSASTSFQDNIFTGLRILHGYSEDAVNGARILALALVESGIPCSLQRSSLPAEFDSIHLIVGLNENGHLRIPRTLDKLPTAPPAQPALNK